MVVERHAILSHPRWLRNKSHPSSNNGQVNRKDDWDWCHYRLSTKNIFPSIHHFYDHFVQLVLLKINVFQHIFTCHNLCHFSVKECIATTRALYLENITSSIVLRFQYQNHKWKYSWRSCLYNSQGVFDIDDHCFIDSSGLFLLRNYDCLHLKCNFHIERIKTRKT